MKARSWHARLSPGALCPKICVKKLKQTWKSKSSTPPARGWRILFGHFAGGCQTASQLAACRQVATRAASQPRLGSKLRRPAYANGRGGAQGVTVITISCLRSVCEGVQGGP